MGASAWERHCLFLHVGAPKGPVGVVVFQKGNQAGGDADQLFGRNVRQVDFVGEIGGNFAAQTR